MNGGIVLDLIPKDPSIKTIERGTDVFLDAIGSFDDCVLNSKSIFSRRPMHGYCCTRYSYSLYVYGIQCVARVFPSSRSHT